MEKRYFCWLVFMTLVMKEETMTLASPSPGTSDRAMVSELYSSKGSSSMPDVLDLNIQLDEHRDITLNLTRNHHVTSMSPIFLLRGGRIVPYQEKQKNEFAAYLDKSKQAGVLVQDSGHENGTTNRKYSGSFQVDGEEFMLEPAPPEQKTSRQKRNAQSGAGYLVYKPDWTASFIDNENSYRLNVSRRRWTQDDDHSFSDDIPDGAAADFPFYSYGVELLVMVDYAIYNQWFQRSQASSLADREKEAIDNIRYYFSQVINGIDLRYMSIEEPDFGVHVRLKGFIVATTPTDSPWTELVPNKVREGSRDYVDIYPALDDLEAWLDKHKSELPMFDHATLFTGNILYDGEENGKKRIINGLTDIQGICSYYKVSICKEKGQYATIQTAAHELGHNLGAAHDGTQNSCSGKDQYLMASTPGVLTTSNYKNAFTLSPCSRHEIRQFLFSLTRKDKNCLLNSIEDAVSLYGDQRPSQRFTLDEQCRIMYGDASFYCGGELNDLLMCRKLVCYSPEIDKCVSTLESRANEWSSCGHHKWCVQGDCVSSNQAPAAKDYCLSGDFKGRFYNGRSCRDIISTEPWQCYPSPFYYSEQCCESCEAIRKTDLQGCDFGDRKSYCRRIRAQDCYSSSVSLDCCETCEQHKTSNPDCLYGDRASWCSSLRPSLCYVNQDTCCLSCVKRPDAPPGCPWGDQASWCKRTRLSECYINDRVCCERCRPEGPKGCEYGDRDSRCDPSDCDDPYYQRLCCKTCNPDHPFYTRHLIASSPITTTFPTSTLFRDAPIATESSVTTKSSSTTPPSSTTLTTPSPRPATNSKSLPSSSPQSSVTTTVSPKSTLADEAMTTSTFGSFTLQQETNITECTEDSSSWCETIHKGFCYLYHSMCCKSCKPIGPAGCEYGDRMRGCTWTSCAEPTSTNLCCETCKSPQESPPVSGPHDMTPPDIVCPSIPHLYTAPEGKHNAKVTWSTPNVWDEECGDNVSVAVIQPVDIANGTYFTEGATNIVYRATDCNGLTAECSFHINVQVHRCQQPHRPAHGSVLCSSSGTVWGDTCTFTCEKGYQLEGAGVHTCQETEIWEGGGKVECVKLNCGRPSIPPHMRLQECTDGFKYTSSCYLKCQDGFTRTQRARGWLTCTADGIWEGILEDCKDMEGPALRGCPADTVVYAERGKDSTPVFWKPPTAWDYVDGPLSVLLLTGPPPGSNLTVGDYLVKYVAEDLTGNHALPCTFIISVQQIECSPLVPRENLRVRCRDGLVYGASCSFSCASDYVLMGSSEAICERTNTDPPSGVWDWGSGGHQPYCQGCHGDQAGWCSRMPDRDCYVTSDNCCKTCRDRERPYAPKGCKYGDLVSWCSSYIRGPEDCLYEAESCCLTCDKLLNPPPPGCVDDAPWCDTLPSSFFCYEEGSRKACCATCHRRKKGPPGCEYGDKARWCKTLKGTRCSPTTKEVCCETCQ